ncbi:MAG: Aldose 1-epimerase [Hyphomicrobiales bacterium]|jgi:galactose mutarotase-like enzyme|nr:Aldose 1-epimerase [Hyphomicrobiales bacterium]
MFGMSRSDSFTLKAGESIARFSVSGAECRQWRVGAREMLWPSDPAVWPAVAPVLFPTCGWSRDGAITVAGKSYLMQVHGFAAQSVFGAAQTGADEIRFTLCDSAETRRHYPFAFALNVTYRLAPDALHAEIAVANTGDAPMPYACGLHPGFVWGAGAHRFVFAQEERPDVPAIAPGGLFSHRRRRVPLEGAVLPLTHDLFKTEALCFTDTRSRSFRFEGPDGTLNIDAPDFPHLVLWSSGAAPFLAIESWTGTGDPEGFAGEFQTRPSMIHLAPGARRAHRVSYRWLSRTRAT